MGNLNLTQNQIKKWLKINNLEVWQFKKKYDSKPSSVKNKIITHTNVAKNSSS